MSKIALVVRFRVKPGCTDELLTLVGQHIHRCLQNEPGCLYFDALRPLGAVDEVRLYEVYADEAALEHHRQTEHLARFREVTAGLVLEREVAECAVV